MLLKLITHQRISEMFYQKNTRYGTFHEINYKVRAHDSSSDVYLIDRGANCGIMGSDMRVIQKLHQNVDVQGIDNHKMNNIPIFTVGGGTITQGGEVIIVLNQYLNADKGTSVHYYPQMKA